MHFNIFNIRISFSFWFFAVIALFASIDSGAPALYFILPVLLHEIGHLLMMGLCGARIETVRFTAFSVDIQKAKSLTLGYTKEIAITLGGIAANLLTALCLYLFMFQSLRVMLMIAANIAIAVFNLLPIGDLDGGMLARLISERLFSLQTADWLSRLASFITLVPLFAAAILLLLRPERNFTLLLVCCYLLLKVILI